MWPIHLNRGENVFPTPNTVLVESFRKISNQYTDERRTTETKQLNNKNRLLKMMTKFFFSACLLVHCRLHNSARLKTINDMNGRGNDIEPFLLATIDDVKRKFWITGYGYSIAANVHLTSDFRVAYTTPIMSGERTGPAPSTNGRFPAHLPTSLSHLKETK